MEEAPLSGFPLIWNLATLNSHAYYRLTFQEENIMMFEHRVFHESDIKKHETLLPLKWGNVMSLSELGF